MRAPVRQQPDAVLVARAHLIRLTRRCTARAHYSRVVLVRVLLGLGSRAVPATSLSSQVVLPVRHFPYAHVLVHAVSAVGGAGVAVVLSSDSATESLIQR